MSTSPRLVYTTMTGADLKFPVGTGTEVTYHESAQPRGHLDGIHSGQVCDIGYTVGGVSLPARVLCDTPRGVQQIRVTDLSVEVA